MVSKCKASWLIVLVQEAHALACCLGFSILPICFMSMCNAIQESGWLEASSQNMRPCQEWQALDVYHVNRKCFHMLWLVVLVQEAHALACCLGTRGTCFGLLSWYKMHMLWLVVLVQEAHALACYLGKRGTCFGLLSWYKRLIIILYCSQQAQVPLTIGLDTNGWLIFWTQMCTLHLIRHSTLWWMVCHGCDHAYLWHWPYQLLARMGILLKIWAGKH